MVEARDGVDGEEIPTVTMRPERPASPHERGPAPKFGAGKVGASKPFGKPTTGPVGRGPAGKPATGKAFGSKKRITPEWDVARLYIGAGRAANVRANDLVGAIVNEAGVDPRAIGAIQITDRFSLVEVPAEIADSIIDALRASTIKGKRVPVRRDREQAWKS
jgi:ATP-dependent RNA helicase DeaD